MGTIANFQPAKCRLITLLSPNKKEDELFIEKVAA